MLREEAMSLLRLALPTSMLLATALACTAKPASTLAYEEDPAEPGAPTTTPAKSTRTPSGTSNSCLGKVGLAFDEAACDTCMSADGCCQKTIACFKDDPDCAALQDCMSKCPQPGSGAGGQNDGGTTSAAKTLFTGTVYPSVQPTCGGCHTAAPVFFGADANATYTIFKSKGFDKAGSVFLTKGVHTGPALTADQQSKMTSWIQAEAAGGGGGTGTGGGSGGGTGGDAGTGGARACQDACKAQHPNAVAKWTDYNTCVTSTCGSSCL